MQFCIVIPADPKAAQLSLIASSHRGLVSPVGWQPHHARRLSPTTVWVLPLAGRVSLAAFSEPKQLSCQDLADMDGYNKLAAVIGRHQGLSMYSRFPVLNAKSLLWMQAELIHLEQQLKNIAIEDSRSGNEGREKYQYSLLHLKCSSGKDGQDRQWRLILEIRIKLKEYSKQNKSPQLLLGFLRYTV
jgi:hypothetical protein